MKQLFLKDICHIKTGKLDANAANDNGLYPFFTCSKEPLKINTFAYDCECVLLGGNGEFNVNMYNGKFNAYQRTYIIEVKDSSRHSLKLLHYIIKTKVQHFKNVSNGGVIKFIKIGDIERIQFPDISIKEQQSIVATLDKINELIDANKRQSELLDEAVKSRFVEMFGNINENNKGFETNQLREFCDAIGDGLHGTPDYDENGSYYFVNGNNLHKDKIKITDSTKKVGKTEYSKHYIAFNESTVFLSINGTLGNVAIYDNEPIIIGKSVAYCVLKGKLNKVFVSELFKSHFFKEYMESESSGSTIKNFGLKALRDYRIIVPPLEMQKEFTEFVKQTEVMKNKIIHNIGYLALLLNKKMDEYFGGDANA
jgi:type I restriction enzyme, S subunit